MTRMATAGMEIIGMTTKARNAVIHCHHIMENLIFSGREGRGGGWIYHTCQQKDTATGVTEGYGENDGHAVARRGHFHLFRCCVKSRV